MDATWKALAQSPRHLQGEAGLADTAWTGDREQPHILTLQEFLGGVHFLLPPPEPGPLYGKIVWTGFYRHNGLVGEAVADGRQLPGQISGRDVTLVGVFRQASLDRPTYGRGGGAGL